MFCDQQQVAVDQRKSIWKQLGGDIDDETLDHSFISIADLGENEDDNHNHNGNHNTNDDNSNDLQIFHSQHAENNNNHNNNNNNHDHNDADIENDGDDDDDDDNESNELILEFEISAHQDLNGNNNHESNKENIATTPNHSRPKAMRAKNQGFNLSPPVITNYVCFMFYVLSIL